MIVFKVFLTNLIAVLTSCNCDGLLCSINKNCKFIYSLFI